jgi:hypothetical protein
MVMKTKIVLMALFVALATMGFDCINDNFLVSVNVNGISGTYFIKTGTTPTFGPPDDCKTVSDYLDKDYSNEITGVQIFDIRITTAGSYNGTINNGKVTVNGVTIMYLNGSPAWSAFNTPQSLLTSPFIDRTPGRINLNPLVNAITKGDPVTLCGSGSVSGTVNQTDLSVRIEVFGQVDAKVK